MMSVCPICGTQRVIYWPEHWVYRNGSTFYCSQQCMDVAFVKDVNAIKEAIKRKEKCAMTKITLEQKKKAVEIAVSGGNPLDYLRELGSNRPDGLWYTIKENLKKVDPETYEKLPDYRGKTRTMKEPEGNMTRQYTREKETAEPPTVKLSGPIRIETEEPEKVEVVSEQKPLKPGLRGLNNSEFEVSAIKHPIFGEFYYDQKFGMVDWRTPDGEEVSMSPKNWKELYLIIPDIMGILRVVDDDE